MSTRTQYRIETVLESYFTESFLEKHTYQGWDLISVVPYGDDAYKLIFKRQMASD
jgi:hypothetical protein